MKKIDDAIEELYYADSLVGADRKARAAIRMAIKSLEEWDTLNSLITPDRDKSEQYIHISVPRMMLNTILAEGEDDD